MNTVRTLSILALACSIAAPALAQLKAPPPPPPQAPFAAPAPNQAREAPPGGPPQTDPLTRDFRDCIQKAQAAMQEKKADDPVAVLACLTGELKRQEARLTSAAQKLSKIMPAEGRKRLDVANADWRRFRGSECNLIADENGPPPANLENANCRLRMTTMRALDIDGSANMLARQEAAMKAQRETAPAAPAPPAAATPPSASAPPAPATPPAK